MRTLLVTGFEPFGGETVNASWEAASALDGWRSGDLVASALMLPVAYDACVAKFKEAFRRLKPDAVLLTGQAARRAAVSVERHAHNRASAALADNCGVVRGGFSSPLVGRGGREGESPASVETTANVAAIARTIRAAGIPARVSTDAGDYVCNHLYYGALKHIVGASPATLAVFLHLPATPEQTPWRANPRRLATKDAVRALRAAATALIA